MVLIFLFYVFQNTQSLKELEKNGSNDQHTNELQSNESFKPMYTTMDSFDYTQYKAIFSREHLKSNDVSTIKINLTKEEEETFNEIKKAMNNKDIFTKQVTVRCAGGWVRDKLLNCSSDDIDLAVDTMTGEEFGDCLQKYFKTIKNEQLNIGKIQENPDKSKHLAAATFKLNNIEFDVVNLRTETYSEQSRVPLMSLEQQRKIHIVEI